MCFTDYIETREEFAVKIEESYRYRIHLKLNSQGGSNQPALRFALLQIPGIQDVVFDSRAGTFTCYVYAIATVAAASLLSNVQDVIDQTISYPLTGVAVNPDLVGFSFATTITLIPGASQTHKDTAVSQAISAAQDYINNLGVDRRFCRRSHCICPNSPGVAARSPCFLHAEAPQHHPVLPGSV